MRGVVFLFRPWKRNELYQRTNSTKHKHITRYFERWGGKEQSSENQFDRLKKRVDKLFEIFLKFHSPLGKYLDPPLIIKMTSKTFLKMTKYKFSTSESKLVNALKNSLKPIKTSALPSSPSPSRYPTPFFYINCRMKDVELFLSESFIKKEDSVEIVTVG